MHDRYHSGSEPTMTVEDDALATGPADDDHLREAFRKPRRYLPPPGTRLHRDTEGQHSREPENKLARRAKLAALIIATALLVASLVIAALLAGQTGQDGAAQHSSGAMPGQIAARYGQP